MKFCKNLQRVVDISDPEWAPYWVNYKCLKKLIKELPSLVPEEGQAGKAVRDRSDSADSSGVSHVTDSCSVSNTSAEPNHGEKTGEPTLEGQQVGATANKKEELGRNPGEIAFFKLLHSECKKATHFFGKAQQEFVIREERVREGLEITKRPNSIMVNEKWSMLAKSIYRLYKDLLLLETFAIMTYCSFSKILKKHDKVTGHNTRAAFMANVVSRANFTNYPQVMQMISRCESLYGEVSDRLLQEGKEGLYEDERLFINMISRLNEQALENPDAPEPEGRRAFSMAKLNSSNNSSATESEQTARLRSLVEENEARSTAHVSEGVNDEDVKVPAAKRPRVN